MKFCSKCGVTKPVSEFHLIRKRRGKVVNRPTSYCRVCWNKLSLLHAQKTREFRLAKARQDWKEKRLLRRIVLEADATRVQPAVCEICEDVNPHGKALAFDHDHQTGKFRGWLCDTCNRTLGMLKDNPSRLRKMALYVESNHLWTQ